MITLSKWYACFWLIGLLVVTSTACRDNLPPSSDKRQHQLSKVIESQYSSDLQLVGRSAKPPILYQGTTYYYAKGIEKTYRYDIQGRLIFKGQMDVDRPNDSYSKEYNTYTYVGDNVIQYYSNSGSYDTLTINSRGYAIPDFHLRNKAIYEYDKDNYLIRRLVSYQGFNDLTSRGISDGNISKEVNENSRLTSTTEHKYDLTHNALPDSVALFNEGKGSLNLLLQSITQYKRPELSAIYGPMDPYTVSASYSYEFDDLNRVSQQTIVETNTNKTTPGIIIKRFTYSN